MVAPAYFLTWHTYGTWLHGDDAGSIDTNHNTHGAPRLPTDPARHNRDLRALTDPPYILSPIGRVLVDKIMREHCQRKGWTLRALAVRSNHVHVVILSRDQSKDVVEAELMVKQLKEWGTRKLRSQRLAGPKQRVWADHGSTIHLFEPGSLEAAVQYVLTMQDGPPAGHSRIGWSVRLGLRAPDAVRE